MTRLTRLTRMNALSTGLVLALGCGGGGSTGDGDDGVDIDASTQEAIVNGKPASQFYGQFTHAMTNRGIDGAAAFATQPDGRNAFLVTFFLMPNNKLELFYAEGDGQVTSTGHSLAIYGTAKKRRMGTWRIEGTELELDSFMRCGGFTFNGKDALRCTLETAIMTPAAVGRTGTFDPGFGTSSPDDSEFADYVP
ncbi:MAG: hypothetical protein M3680_05960 [Myxococcota bacterium]|nr:hypothetical protein [Myxococcota bacterium]